MSAVDELERLAHLLRREAQHWKDHPDRLTLRREAVSPGRNLFEQSREELAARWLQFRCTHTDLVMREVAHELERIAARMGKGAPS